MWGGFWWSWCLDECEQPQEMDSSRLSRWWKFARHFYFIEKRWLISKKKGSLLVPSYSFTLVCRDVFNVFLFGGRLFVFETYQQNLYGPSKVLQAGSYRKTSEPQSQENEFVDLDVKAFASPLGRHCLKQRNVEAGEELWEFVNSKHGTHTKRQETWKGKKVWGHFGQHIAFPLRLPQLEMEGFFEMGFPIGGIPWSWGKSPIREAKNCRLAGWVRWSVGGLPMSGLRLSGLRVFFLIFFPRTWVVLFFRIFVYFCHISSPKYVTVIHLSWSKWMGH